MWEGKKGEYMYAIFVWILILFLGVRSVQSSVDLAVHKFASQSSTLANFEAKNAVNGIQQEDFSSDNCASTDHGHLFAWWRVDLGDMYRIKNIAITYRWKCHLRTVSWVYDTSFVCGECYWTGCLGRTDADFIVPEHFSNMPQPDTCTPTSQVILTLGQPVKANDTITLSGYYLYISNTTDDPESGHLCYHDNTTFPIKKVPNYIQHINCTYVGRYVTVYNRGQVNQETLLELCEVQVFGCAPQKFGHNCQHTCQCLNSGCDPENGLCDIPGCATDWMGDNCTIKLDHPTASNTFELEVGLGVGGAFIVLMTAVIIFLVQRKRRRSIALGHQYITLQEKGTYCNLEDDIEGCNNHIFTSDTSNGCLQGSIDTYKELLNVLSVKIEKGLPDVEYEVLQTLKNKAEHDAHPIDLLELGDVHEATTLAGRDSIMGTMSHEGNEDRCKPVLIPSIGEGYLAISCPSGGAFIEFWNTVMDNNSNVIVTFGNYDNGYWPTSENMTLSLNPIILCCTETHILNSAVQKSTIQVENLIRQETRTVTLLKPDSNVTSENVYVQKSPFLRLIKATLEESKRGRRQSSQPVVLAHRCDTDLAGLFGVLCGVLERLNSFGAIDIFTAARCVQSVLPESLSTIEQYRYCYNFVHEILEASV